MNQKDFTRGYARILDRVAGRQVPQDLDLAPHIIARIQKQKRFPMQPRMKFFTAAGLVAIVLIVMISTVPGMAAAIGRWFGYVPVVGFVREGQIRVLDQPVSITRAGITVTVDQVILDPERTALVYSVEGIPETAIVSNPLDQHCPYKVALRLPDGATNGDLLLASPNGIQSWASGYQHRFYYPPVPAAVNDATLVIDCLFNTKPGAAPQNWEIPLHFVPASQDVTAYPVIDIATPTNVVTATTPPKSTPQPISMRLTLDRAVRMDDGFLIYATIQWKDTPFVWVDVTEPNETLHLLDANGQSMLYEFRYDEQTGMNVDQRQTTFVIKTAPVQTPGPLTLVLDSVSVELPVNASFVFDPGPDPKTGQTWTLNQDVMVGPYNLLVKSATAESGGYSFEMSSENGIINATLLDPVEPIVSGGGGSGGNPGENFFYAINYADGQLPAGPVTLTVSSIGVKQVQRMEAQWIPPAASSHLLPTQPAACLTTAAWKAALAQKPPLPKGINGRVLVSGQLDKPQNNQWSVAILSLDGTRQQVIKGAQDGSISPDNTKLAYSTLNQGLGLMDLTTGQVSPIPGTGNGDFNPIWSPDNKQIVFNRGMGIFDLFIVEPDGSNMRQITHGGVQEWPVGWLPDGRLIYTVPGRENESTNYAVDLESGKADLVTDTSLLSIAPDGKTILTSEKTFGDRWLIYISELGGSNRRLLNDSGLSILTSVWSPDGLWLLANIADNDPARSIAALISLSTCQVIPVPNIQGNLLSWIP